MTGPEPTTPSHKSEAIGTYVRAKIQIEKSEQALEQRRQRTEEVFAKAFADLERERVTWERWGPWVCRVFFFVFLILSLGLTETLIIGLLSGETNSISRFRSVVVTLDSNPLYYWFSLGFYSVFTTFFWYATVVTWRGARWRK
jgi:hypothetical protein